MTTTVSSGVTSTWTAGAGPYIVKGTLKVNSGSVASGDTVSNGGKEIVSSGGTENNVAVVAGGQLTINAGGHASGGSVSGVSGFVNDSGTTTGLTVGSGGNETVFGGGVASNTTVQSGGTEVVSAGGHAIGGTVSGTLTNLGATTGLTIASGGSDTVVGGAVASNSIILGGGTETVSAGGSALGAVVSSGGTEAVSQYALASNTVISNGGVETVAGTANSTVISNGGMETVLAGGAENNVNLLAGGQLNIAAGGNENGGTATGASANVNVSGKETGLTVGGGAHDTVFSGGVANNTNVISGGTEVVSAGGVASGSVISAGGSEVISAGGSATDVVISSGGLETVLSGGVATGSLVAGGSEVISAGGEEDNASVTGGTLTYQAGAQGTGDYVSGTGVVNVSGTVTGITVDSGGQDVIQAGGVASGSTVLAGGSEVVSAGGLETGADVQSGADVQVFAGGSVTNVTLEDGGYIEFGNLSSSPGASVTFNSSTDTLTLHDGAVTSTIQLAGTYTSGFQIVANGGSTDVYYGTACYLAGTGIRTPQGDVAVETLNIGDLLVTASGAIRPIRWIGTRSYSGRFLKANPAMLPIRFKRDSLAEGIPYRDLSVSPKHAMLIDGVLVPAEALVNGESIVKESSAESVEYFHVEFDSHDVVIAEGALSESFVDDNSRGMFLNAAEYQQRYPDAVATAAVYCAPRVEEGFELDAVLRKLAVRTQGDTRQPGALRGFVEGISRERIHGWVQDLSAPEQPVQLQIVDNGAVIACVMADQYQPRLLQAGLGSGRHGFDWVIEGGLDPLRAHDIQVRRAADGQNVPIHAAKMHRAA
jgi:autotransporter passenger strand-loop-strand repeat protein